MRGWLSLIRDEDTQPPDKFNVVLLILTVMLTIMCASACGDYNRDRSSDIERQTEADLNKKGRVIYTNKEIRKGELIALEDVEERELLQRLIPENACNSTSQAVGQVAAYTIPAGTLLTSKEFAPQSTYNRRDDKRK
jgi:flagella basal body P-ring formation protein FlgA